MSACTPFGDLCARLNKREGPASSTRKLSTTPPPATTGIAAVTERLGNPVSFQHSEP
jgi:hypothetical protein